MQHLFQSYLISYLYWLAFPVGASVLIMMYRLTGGEWGSTAMRFLEPAARTLPAFAVLILPILAGQSLIYSWAQPAMKALLHGGNGSYLTQGFFAARSVLYLVGWSLFALFALKKDSPRIGRIAAGGLVFYGLSSAFASFDWQMSVDPGWHSTIYGLIFAVGQILQCWAGVLLLLVLDPKVYDAQKLKNQRDLANLMLAYIMVWAYLSFMQYLIIWAGNLPEEVTWYVSRTRHGWQVPAIALAVLQFALPFSLLLFRPIKQRSRWIFVVAGVVLIMRWIEQYWLLEPGFEPGHFYFDPWVILTFALLGGIWITLFRAKLRRQEVNHVRA